VFVLVVVLSTGLFVTVPLPLCVWLTVQAVRAKVTQRQIPAIPIQNFIILPPYQWHPDFVFFLGPFAHYYFVIRKAPGDTGEADEKLKGDGVEHPQSSEQATAWIV